MKDPVRVVARDGIGLACALVLGGCGGGAGGAWAELGFGEGAFVPAGDGEAVGLDRGAQGGYHLWVSVRAAGIDPAGARVRTAIHPEGAPRPAQQGVRERTLEPAEDEPVHQLVGLPTVISYAGCFADRRTVVELTLTGGQGRRLGDRVVVVPVPDGGPPPEPCPYDE